jgi:hypothetical protein
LIIWFIFLEFFLLFYFLHVFFSFFIGILHIFTHLFFCAISILLVLFGISLLYFLLILAYLFLVFILLKIKKKDLAVVAEVVALAANTAGVVGGAVASDRRWTVGRVVDGVGGGGAAVAAAERAEAGWGRRRVTK